VKRIRRILLPALGILIALCAVSGLIAVWSNRDLPLETVSVDRLSPVDKARLLEALHLKSELGDSIWPGWGDEPIPVLLWNRESSFLIGHPNPPPPWETVPGDTIGDQPYQRRATTDHENFAVAIGDVWVASMATKTETDRFLIEGFQEMLPPVLDDVFPYQLLVRPSEVQISGVLHETSHVFQARQAGERLDHAESAHQLGSEYWTVDEQMRAAWQTEIDLLATALEADRDGEARTLVQGFLKQREGRRQEHNLAPELIDFERWLEWEEGLAKYVELAAWRAAAISETYQPTPGMDEDPDFQRYSTFNRHWSQEISQMKRQSTKEGETRFYYTGMAQGMLLDRLLPGWKTRVLEDGIWLETLLEEIQGEVD
jgi:hypothetical protein